MTITRSTLLGLAVALALAGGPALAASQDEAPTGDKASNALYWQGQAALKQSDWSTALQRFQELESCCARTSRRASTLRCTGKRTRWCRQSAPEKRRA